MRQCWIVVLLGWVVVVAGCGGGDGAECVGEPGCAEGRDATVEAGAEAGVPDGRVDGAPWDGGGFEGDSGPDGGAGPADGGLDGSCAGGEACDDGNPCTVDRCDPSSGVVHELAAPWTRLGPWSWSSPLAAPATPASW